MKTKPYFLTYLSALIVGVLLLVFTGKADIFRWMVIIIGILFLLPSLWVIISGATGSKKNGVRTEYATDATGGNNDTRRSHNVFLTVIGVCGLVFGVILLSMSGFFAQYIVYTLGVVLILCGLAQIVYMAAVSALAGVNRWFYLMPWLTLIAGIVVIFLGPDGVGNIITWLAGVFLVAYAVNGMVQMAVNRRQKRIGM